MLPLVPEFPGDYHEVFLGGGSVFFELLNCGLLTDKRVRLADASPDLVNALVVVRDQADALVAQLGVLKALPHCKETYYQIRSQDPATLTDVERAARTIFLNKTGFNGLHRVDKHGGFNVPVGKHKNPGIFDEAVLRADSLALQGATITCADFRTSLLPVQPGDFVYLDPPYVGGFNQYTAHRFTMTDQESLAVEFERLVALGAHAMLSNADTDWVRERYAAFRQDQVMVPRAVNSNGKGRGLVPELIVIGWEPSTGATSPAAPVSTEVRS